MKLGTFLIKSKQNKSFGTAFCVAKDEKGSFLVTCAHVVYSCGAEDLIVDGKDAKLIVQGSSKDIDLAVVYVHGLTEVMLLALSSSLCMVNSIFKIDGFKVHKDGTHLQRVLEGEIKKVSQIHNNSKQVDTYELMIERVYAIEKGYSGSALLCNGQVIGVATDKNSNGKQAYAIPIYYLSDIWESMPKEIFETQKVTKQNFIHEVFESLDSNPLLLFSTDSFIHTDYIESMREEAIDIFERPYVLEINCGRYGSIQDRDKFFSRLSKKLGFAEVADSIDFEDAMINRITESKGLKLFILVIGFERLQEDVRNSFAESLRNLQEEYGSQFNLVIFGGQKLITLKYSTGVHSYFNTFEQKMIPTLTFEEWREKFPNLSRKVYDEVTALTGGYPKLSEVCFKAEVSSAQEAQKLLDESTWKSELFRAYRKEKLAMLLSQERLGNAHPYSDNELLYKLYWDNLIVEEKGVFVWRSAFLVAMGKAYFGLV